jgi:hypothetical protein
MPILNVKVDVSQLVSELHDIQKKQLPFALASALTATAQDGQKEVQRSLPSKFTLRNRFTEQGIRIKPADKNKLPAQADVHTDTANRKTGAPDYLGLQEEGGEKIPVNGHQHLAVPTKYLRQMCPGVIPQELRPKSLLGAVNGRYAGRTKKGQIALRDQKIVRGFVFFLQTLKSGNPAIMGRYWTEQEAFPFYILISEARLRPRLKMEEQVARVVQDRFPRQWDLAWERILKQGMKL